MSGARISKYTMQLMFVISFKATSFRALVDLINEFGLLYRETP
jgi:hypothetical protein